MYEGQLTPRGAKKAMTLDRAFDHQPWIYNRNTSDRFDGDTVLHDKAKAKLLKKKLRQLRRSAVKRDSSQTLTGMQKSSAYRSGSISASRTNASR